MASIDLKPQKHKEISNSSKNKNFLENHANNSNEALLIWQKLGEIFNQTKIELYLFDDCVIQPNVHQRINPQD